MEYGTWMKETASKIRNRDTELSMNRGLEASLRARNSDLP